MVEAPEELEVAIGEPAGAVPGGVHPLPRDRRIGQEARRRLFGVAVVAQRQARTGDVEVARGPDRGGPVPFVQDVVPRVLDRTAVRDARPVRLDRLDDVDVRPDGGLRRATQRHHPRAGEAGPDLVGHADRDPVPAQEHQAQVVPAVIGLPGQERQHPGQRRGRGVPEGDGLVEQQPGQPRRFGQVRVVHQPDRRAGGQDAEHVVDGQVETERGDLQKPVGRPDLEAFVHPLHEVDQGPVADADPLGNAGRAGREDHVRHVVRGGPDRQRLRRLPAQMPAGPDARRIGVAGGVAGGVAVRVDVAAAQHDVEALPQFVGQPPGAVAPPHLDRRPDRPVAHRLARPGRHREQAGHRVGTGRDQVREDHRTAGPDDTGQPAQDVAQVPGVREVLHGTGQHGHVVHPAHQPGDLVREARYEVDEQSRLLRPRLVHPDRLVRGVHPGVQVDVGRDAAQHEPGAEPHLQHGGRLLRQHEPRHVPGVRVHVASGVPGTAGQVEPGRLHRVGRGDDGVP